MDPARVEHLIRQTVEEMMPQIVDRIVRAVGIALQQRTDSDGPTEPPNPR